MSGLRYVVGDEQEDRARDQGAFETVYRHLMGQGARSCVEHPRGISIPAYYGRHGRRCAVGCLIPIEEYDPIFETMNLEEVARRCPSLHRVDLNLLYALRVCHDELTPRRWKKRLATIAGVCGVIVSETLERVPLRERETESHEYDGRG